LPDNPLKDFGLPPSVSWPLIAISVFATAWPSIHELLLSTVPWRRRYERTKRELELLKLRYEIEILRKEHNLEAIAEERSEPQESISKSVPLPSRKLRFVFGFLGGSITIFIAMAIRALLINTPLVATVGLPFLLGSFVFGILGGILGLILPGKMATASTCFFAGITLALTVQAFVAAVQPQPRLAPSVSQELSLRCRDSHQTGQCFPVPWMRYALSALNPRTFEGIPPRAEDSVKLEVSALVHC